MQVPLRIHVPLQLLNVALSAGLPLDACSACYAAAPRAPCIARMHALQLLVGFLVPTAIIYLVEMRFRTIFLRGRVSIIA